MKAYTDINQSKRLEEILPIESADMCYPLPYEDGDKPLLVQGGFGSTPCWSLASLLEYFKDKFDFELLYLSNTVDNKNNKIKNVYKMSIDMFVDKLDIYATEAIDACVEMIIKLHEQKLL